MQRSRPEPAGFYWAGTNLWLLPGFAGFSSAQQNRSPMLKSDNHLRSHDLWVHADDLPKRNPHPCGYYGDSKRQCRCSVRQIENYRQRISGPLLDRIDLHVEVPLVEYRELSSASGGEKSEVLRERVMQARAIQKERLKGSKAGTNAAMGARQVKEHCKLDAEASGYMEHAMEQLNFSARAHDRILKVARTLADLAGSLDIRPNDVLEAIQYRSLDRNLFQ